MHEITAGFVRIRSCLRNADKSVYTLRIHRRTGHGSFGGQDQICSKFRQSPLRPRSSTVGLPTVSTTVSPPHGGEVWGGGCAPSPENFPIFELKKASFGASLVLFFAVD